MFDELMIADKAFSSARENKLALQIRLPWYRSLPLSCVERMELSVDGQAVPQSRMQILSDGIAYPPEALSGLCDTQWFILDTKQLLLSLEQPLAPGIHRVSLSMQLRIPYRDTNYGVQVDEKYIQYAVCNKEVHWEGGVAHV